MTIMPLHRTPARGAVTMIVIDEQIGAFGDIRSSTSAYRVADKSVIWVDGGYEKSKELNEVLEGIWKTV